MRPDAPQRVGCNRGTAGKCADKCDCPQPYPVLVLSESTTVMG